MCPLHCQILVVVHLIVCSETVMLEEVTTEIANATVSAKLAVVKIISLVLPFVRRSSDAVPRRVVVACEIATAGHSNCQILAPKVLEVYFNNTPWKARQ